VSNTRLGKIATSLLLGRFCRHIILTYNSNLGYCGDDERKKRERKNAISKMQFSKVLISLRQVN